MAKATKTRQRHQRFAGLLSRAVLASCACLSVVQAGNRIVFDSLRPLVTTRLDPIVFPGTVSQHVHRVIGANNFHANYDPVQLRQSTCSSMAPQADLSNYWHPSVYKVVVQPDGSTKYAPMWGQTRIYYNFPTLKKGTGPGTYVEPFPDNFQMIAGSPSKKVGGRYLQEDLSIFYYCEQDYGNGTVVGYSTYDLPKFGCSFLTTKVWFPSCWNGQAFDITNVTAHVQYPLIGAGLTGPNCPVGYERRIPSILVETFYFGYGTNGWMKWYNTSYDQWGGNGDSTPTYILANGDTTGYGLHADFSNGWNTTVLSQVVTQCLNTDINLRADKACPPLAPSWNQTTANNCVLNQNTQIADEAIGNLPWPNGTKPICPGYMERRWTNWSRLVGVELNPEPSLADLVNDPFGLNGTSTTSTTTTDVGTATSTGTASTSVSFDTNSTTLTVPTTSVVVPTTTSMSNASPTVVTDTTTVPTDGTTSSDVCLTRGTACDTTGLTSGDSSATSSTVLTNVSTGTTTSDTTNSSSGTTTDSSASATSGSASQITSGQSLATSWSSTGLIGTDVSSTGLSSTGLGQGSSTSDDSTTMSDPTSTSASSSLISTSIVTDVTSTSTTQITAVGTTTTKQSSATTTKVSTSTTQKPLTTSTRPASTTKKTSTSTKKTSTTTSKISTTTKKTSATTKIPTSTTKKASTTTKKASTTTTKKPTSTSKLSTTSKALSTSKPPVALAPGRGGGLSSKKTTSTSSKANVQTATTSSRILLAPSRGRGLSSSESQTSEEVPLESTEESLVLTEQPSSTISAKAETGSLSADGVSSELIATPPALGLFRGRRPVKEATSGLQQRDFSTSPNAIYTLRLYREL